MKKVKLSSVTKVSSLASGERVLSLSSDMTQIKASAYAPSTALYNASRTEFTGDNAHEIYDIGLTIIVISNGVTSYGFPYNSGLIMHTQRMSKGDSTASQVVNQMFFTSQAVFHRSGFGNGSGVTYTAWKKITMVDV